MEKKVSFTVRDFIHGRVQNAVYRYSGRVVMFIACLPACLNSSVDNKRITIMFFDSGELKRVSHDMLLKNLEAFIKLQEVWVNVYDNRDDRSKDRQNKLYALGKGVYATEAEAEAVGKTQKKYIKSIKI